MSESRRPKNPRPVADGSADALRKHLGDPPDEGTFADGVRAHVDYRQRMCPESEAGCNLGEYIEPRSHDEGTNLGGRTRKINFPDFFYDWFSRQTPKRLATMDEIIDERLERAVLHKFWSRIWKLGLWLVPGSATAVYFLADKIPKVVEQIPVIRGLWNAIMGKTT